MSQSGLYAAQVMHNRLAPKKHRFSYRIFMFWLDIDALDADAKRLTLFGLRNGNIFRFVHADHFKYKKGDARNTQHVRQKLNDWLASQGVEVMPARVMLLTHVRLFGYVFNPVSFYFCYDEQGNCTYVVTEISNTFGEMKLFLVNSKEKEGFLQEDTKYFYVSPFTEMDDRFVFRYAVPAERLQLRIDTLNSRGERYFISTLSGKRKTLSDLRLFWYICRFPLVTLQIIGAIHWHAFRLWLKKLPFHRKSDTAELQRGITNDRVALPEETQF